MALKIVKYVGKKKEPRWSIRSRNGKIIADSAEGYSSAAMRDKGLKLLLEAIHKGDFKIVDETPAPKPVPTKKAAKKVVVAKVVKGVKVTRRSTLKAGNAGAVSSGVL